MIARLFLGLQAALLGLYGLYCLVEPGSLAGAAGIAASTPTGTIELQAMYGGLQTSVGLLCGLAVFRLSLRHTALVMLVFVFAGLGVVRVTLGLTQGVYTDYNVGAMAYETFSFAVAFWLVLRRPA